jgi:hypothetical protein
MPSSAPDLGVTFLDSPWPFGQTTCPSCDYRTLDIEEIPALGSPLPPAESATPRTHNPPTPQIGKVERLGDDALAGKGSIAVQRDRQNPRSAATPPR